MGKLFYKINEVSAICGVKPHVLRYWETEFSSLTPKKGSNDQRVYKQEDIDTLLKIKKLLYDDKFTIEGAKKILKDKHQKILAKNLDIEETIRTIKEELIDIKDIIK